MPYRRPRPKTAYGKRSQKGISDLAAENKNFHSVFGANDNSNDINNEDFTIPRKPPRLTVPALKTDVQSLCTDDSETEVEEVSQPQRKPVSELVDPTSCQRRSKRIVGRNLAESIEEEGPQSFLSSGLKTVKKRLSGLKDSFYLVRNPDTSPPIPKVKPMDPRKKQKRRTPPPVQSRNKRRQTKIQPGASFRGPDLSSTLQATKPAPIVSTKPKSPWLSSRNHTKSTEGSYEEWYPDRAEQRKTRSCRKSRTIYREYDSDDDQKQPAVREPETIEISSDEEDEVVVSSSPRKTLRETLHVARVGIGKSVYTGCEMEWSNIAQPKLTLVCDERGRRRTRRTTRFELILTGDAVQEIAFYETDGSRPHSFVSLKVKATHDNGLQALPNRYQENETDERGYILVEFLTRDDLHLLLTALSNVPVLGELILSGSSLTEAEARERGKVLIRQALNDDQDTIGNEKQAQLFLKGRTGNDFLLAYPFAGSKARMEAAATGLHECSGAIVPSDDDDDKEEEAQVRYHSAEIRVNEYNRLLQPDEFLNDSLVDFWMIWMFRNGDPSMMHIFSTHFFSSLQDGPEAVRNWTEKKGIDVFSKKFIFIPINEHLHWSLAVLVNPGEILNGDVDDDSPIPAIIMLDSLRAHRTDKIATELRKWLNSEWTRLGHQGNRPFNKNSMPLIAPKIPYQDNSWDCGVFVCRYAWAMYQLRDELFSKEQSAKKFKELITNGVPFRFGMEDIIRLRQNLRTLIENLSAIYIPWKKRYDQKLKEERAKEKRKASGSPASAMSAEAGDNATGTAGEEAGDDTSHETCEVVEDNVTGTTCEDMTLSTEARSDNSEPEASTAEEPARKADADASSMEIDGDSSDDESMDTSHIPGGIPASEFLESPTPPQDSQTLSQASMDTTMGLMEERPPKPTAVLEVFPVPAPSPRLLGRKKSDESIETTVRDSSDGITSSDDPAVDDEVIVITDVQAAPLMEEAAHV